MRLVHEMARRSHGVALLLVCATVWLNDGSAIAEGADNAGTAAQPEQQFYTPVRPVSWQWWLSVTDQGGPPPPALRPYLPQFLPLYASYQSLHAFAKKPSFSGWLIMHGVVDPTAHQAMLLLYQWAQRSAG